MVDNDPLKALVVDEGDLTRTELAEVLQPLVRLTEDGRFVPEPAFDRLTSRQKVTAALLTLRAQAALGMRDDAVASPSDLEAASGIPGGTLRPKLSDLVKRRIATKCRGGYEIPLHAMRRAADLLRRDET